MAYSLDNVRKGAARLDLIEIKKSWPQCCWKTQENARFILPTHVFLSLKSVILAETLIDWTQRNCWRRLIYWVESKPSRENGLFISLLFASVQQTSQEFNAKTVVCITLVDVNTKRCWLIFIFTRRKYGWQIDLNVLLSLFFREFKINFHCQFLTET
jgi:hypothetical protein